MNRTLKINSRFATPDFPQTRRGLYICGINWGGRDGDKIAAEVGRRRSFFSDQEVPTYRYRRRIENWFRLWGYPMATTKESAGNFEYGISQTNWLSGRSEKSGHRANPNYLAAHVDEFIDVIEARDPAGILLFGSCLGSAVEKCIAALSRSLGPLILSETVTFHEKFPFTLRYFEFDRCTIIALPHPTGAVGITDAQAARCRPFVERALGFLPLFRCPCHACDNRNRHRLFQLPCVQRGHGGVSGKDKRVENKNV